MSLTLKRGLLCLAALALVVAPTLYHPEVANAEEVTGNCLSYPVIFTGAPIALRGTQYPEYSFAGTYWSGWIDPGTGEQGACDPGVAGCEYPDSIYLQQDPLNIWQAQYVAGAGPQTIAYLDWGDNLESQIWTTRSMIRVELVPFATDTAGLHGYQMWWAWGLGMDEMWGAHVVDGVPITTQPGYATVHTADAWLTLSKLQAGEGDPAVPPTGNYTWDPVTRTWSGTTTLAVEAFTAELNIKGRVMYGYNWQLRRDAFPDKAGWWRLTFSTSDGSVLFTEQTIPTPPRMRSATKPENRSSCRSSNPTRRTSTSTSRLHGVVAAASSRVPSRSDGPGGLAGPVVSPP